jgi:hypothetical protein
VKTASGLDTHNALCGQRLRTGKNELIFLRADVIRNDVDVVCVAEALAERFNGRRNVFGCCENSEHDRRHRCNSEF